MNCIRHFAEMTRYRPTIACQVTRLTAYNRGRVLYRKTNKELYWNCCRRSDMSGNGYDGE